MIPGAKRDGKRRQKQLRDSAFACTFNTAAWIAGHSARVLRNASIISKIPPTTIDESATLKSGQ